MALDLEFSEMPTACAEEFLKDRETQNEVMERTQMRLLNTRLLNKRTSDD